MPNQYTSKRVPSCHPERKYCARGMCAACYQRDYLAHSESARATRDANLARRTPEQKARYTENARIARQAPERRERAAKWRKENAAWMRADHVKRKYGITLEQDRALGNVCDICGVTCKPLGRVPNGRCIDHDHATGKVRGLLCRECNLAIGTMGDDPDRLEKAARYLRASAT